MCRLKYTVRLQAALQPGDSIQSVKLVGSIANDTGERPILAYLYGPDANLVSSRFSYFHVALRPPSSRYSCASCRVLGCKRQCISAAAWRHCSKDEPLSSNNCRLSAYSKYHLRPWMAPLLGRLLMGCCTPKTSWMTLRTCLWRSRVA